MLQPFLVHLVSPSLGQSLSATGVPFGQMHPAVSHNPLTGLNVVSGEQVLCSQRSMATGQSIAPVAATPCAGQEQMGGPLLSHQACILPLCHASRVLHFALAWSPSVLHLLAPCRQPLVHDLYWQPTLSKDLPPFPRTLLLSPPHTR